MAKKIKKPAPVPVETGKFTAKERAAFKARGEAVRLAVMADSKAKRVKVPVITEAADDFLKASLEIDEPIKPQPVEGDKPGTARVPKVKPAVLPVKFNADQDQNARIAVLELHLAKLLERLSAEHGGVHTQAAEALRADTAR